LIVPGAGIFLLTPGMKKSEWKQLGRDYFSLTRSERNGMLVLCSVLLISVVLNILADRIDLKKPVDPQKFLTLMNQLQEIGTVENTHDKKLFLFDPNTVSKTELDSLAIPEQIKRNLIRYREKGGVLKKTGDLRKLYGMTDSLYSALLPFIKVNVKSPERKSAEKEVHKVDYFEFDPNKVTEEQLKQLGFTSFQVRNLTEFRKKGGKFRRENDLLKIYGIDSLFFETISKWIFIPEVVVSRPDRQPVQQIELNLADSASLTLLQGIGPAFARRIIRFRDRLGGFCTADQLLEVYGMTEERFRQLTALVHVDPSRITRIDLNFADYPALAAHPYITGIQARKIIEWRSAKGPYTRKEALQEAGIFDEKTFRKLEPYLRCE
jgi:DNA uptake protein ComE-like DNA-binding protein